MKVLVHALNLDYNSYSESDSNMNYKNYCRFAESSFPDNHKAP